MLKWSLTVLAGAVLGAVLAVLGFALVSHEARAATFEGVGLGFGAGFGAVAAVWVLNKLVGFFDRLASGKP
jgi:predicted membrane protein